MVCESVTAVLQDAHRHKKNTLIEGIHLLPSIVLKKREEFPELKMVFIYLSSDFSYFTDVLLPNRTVSSYRHLSIEGYDYERILRFMVFHKMWAEEFNKNNIQYIKNCSSPEDLVEKILNQVIAEIAR